MSQHTHHISSPATLISTFVALVALTVLTCALATLDLGEFDMPVTLGIATVKALLVAVIFMQLQYDKLFNSILLISAAAFLVLFIGMTILDSKECRPDVESYLYDQELSAAP